MAVPPQPPSAVIAQPPGLAPPTATSFSQQPPAGPLQAVAESPSHRWWWRQGWEDGDGGHNGQDKQQFVPHGRYDASGEWTWCDVDGWHWTASGGWKQEQELPMWWQ